MHAPNLRRLLILVLLSICSVVVWAKDRSGTASVSHLDLDSDLQKNHLMHRTNETSAPAGTVPAPPPGTLRMDEGALHGNHTHTYLDQNFVMQHALLFMVLCTAVWGLCFYCFCQMVSKLPEQDALNGYGPALRGSLSIGGRGSGTPNRGGGGSTPKQSAAPAGRPVAPLLNRKPPRGPSSLATAGHSDPVDGGNQLALVGTQRGGDDDATYDDAADAIVINVAAAGSTGKVPRTQRRRSSERSGAAIENTYDFLHAVLPDLNIPQYAIDEYVGVLKDSHLNTTEQLRALDDSDWTRLELDHSVKSHLRNALAH